MARQIVVTICSLSLLVVSVMWAAYNQNRAERMKSACDLVAFRRLLVFARAIEDASDRHDGHVPDSQEEVWKALGGESRVAWCLPNMFCDPLAAEPFSYRRLSTNSFAVSFIGYRGHMEVICDNGKFQNKSTRIWP